MALRRRIPSADGAQPGARVGDRYRLVRCLGRGGMGEVWEAVHLYTRRPVALKRIHRSLLRSDPAAADRFFAEASLQASVCHPGVVEVLDAGRELDGTAYLVLELLRGQDLETALQQGRVRPRDLVRAVTKLLDALSACHARGILHLDVKPSNVFLAQSEVRSTQVKLLDFGVAQRKDSAQRPRFGTLEYMSPEQARNERVTHRSDLFSVAAILYRGLSGRPPFQASSLDGLVARSHRPPPSLRTLRPDAPDDLVEVVDRGLAAAPDRWSRAEDLAQALVICDHRHLAEMEPPRFQGPAKPTASAARDATEPEIQTYRIARARRNPSLA